MNNDVETQSQRRRIVLMVMASAFMVWQIPAMDFFASVADGGNNLKGVLSAAGFLIWAGGLVFLLTSGRTAAKSGNPAVLSALEDELVRSNRSRAFAIGYFVTLATSAILFGITLIEPLTGNDAAHLILVVAVVTPMYAFVVLERSGA
jgi:hypothetical protein